MEVEIVDAAAAGALAVQRHALGLRRNPQGREVLSEQAGDGECRHAPGQQVVAEIGERVADGGQLPVEDRDDARLGRVEDQVVDAEVAVDDGCFLAGREVCRQPLDQPVHRLDPAGVRILQVLPRPAADLPGEVVPRLAEVREADRAVVHGVQRGERADRGLVVASPRVPRQLGQRRVPEDAAVDEVHHVERRADDAGVVAVDVHGRDGEAGHAAERLLHPELAIHRVRGGEQRPGRLAPQHVAARGGLEPVGRIGLAAREPLGADGAGKAGQRLAQVAFQPQRVDGQGAGRRGGGGVQGPGPPSCGLPLATRDSIVPARTRVTPP